MEREEPENAKLEEIVEESSEAAEAHGVPRREVEKLTGSDDVDPQDGAGM